MILTEALLSAQNFPRLCSEHEPTDRVDRARCRPRDRALQKHDAERARARIQLAADRRDGCHAGRVEQGEHEKTYGGQRREKPRQRSPKLGKIRAEQYRHCRNYRFLCGEARDERGRCAPIAEAERREYRCDEASDQRKQAVRAVCDDVQPQVKALQEPYYDRRRENYAERARKEIFRLVVE